MNCVIVQARCRMDDLVVGVFGTEKEARDFASTLDAGDVLDVSEGVYGMDMDADSPFGLSLVWVEDGRPVRVEFIEEFDGPSTAAVTYRCLSCGKTSVREDSSELPDSDRDCDHSWETVSGMSNLTNEEQDAILGEQGNE